MSLGSKVMLIPWFGAVVIICWLLATSIPKPPIGEEHALYHVKVLKTFDDYHYCLKDDRGTVFTTHFCEDYEPQFDAGMTLDVLTYDDYGWCWSVRNTHPAYLIHRKNGRIVKEQFDARSCEDSGPTATTGPTLPTSTAETSGSTR